MKPTCPKPLPMKEWVQQEAEGSCRPCLLTPILPWYRNTLRERGYHALADRVDALGNQEDLDPVRTAELLDEAKASVDPETACTLAQYDSLAQDAEAEVMMSESQA